MCWFPFQLLNPKTGFSFASKIEKPGDFVLLVDQHPVYLFVHQKFLPQVWEFCLPSQPGELQGMHHDVLGLQKNKNMSMTCVVLQRINIVHKLLLFFLTINSGLPSSWTVHMLSMRFSGQWMSSISDCIIKSDCIFKNVSAPNKDPSTPTLSPTRTVS